MQNGLLLGSVDISDLDVSGRRSLKDELSTGPKSFISSLKEIEHDQLIKQTAPGANAWRRVEAQPLHARTRCYGGGCGN